MACRPRSLVTLLALLGGCTMANPAFDDAGSDPLGTGSEGQTDEASSASAEAGDGDPGDGDPGDGDPGDGDPNGCPPDQEECSGDCVYTKTDPFNCGGCGIECDEAQECLGSECIGPEGRPRVVFVSSESVSGGFGGPDIGDELCDALAAEAGLDGNFEAWMSVGVDGPANTFSTDGYFELVDGTLIANNWADLTDGSILHPIGLDQFGNVALGGVGCGNVNNAVWTGVSPKGLVMGPNCYDWSAEDGEGMVGYLDATGEGWTIAPNCAVACFEALPVYCFEQ